MNTLNNDCLSAQEPLINLDNFLLVKIFKHLDINALSCMRQTCKKFKRFTEYTKKHIQLEKINTAPLFIDGKEIKIQFTTDKRLALPYIALSCYDDI